MEKPEPEPEPLSPDLASALEYEQQAKAAHTLEPKPEQEPEAREQPVTWGAAEVAAWARSLAPQLGAELAEEVAAQVE